MKTLPTCPGDCASLLEMTRGWVPFGHLIFLRDQPSRPSLAVTENLTEYGVGYMPLSASEGPDVAARLAAWIARLEATDRRAQAEAYRRGRDEARHRGLH